MNSIAERVIKTIVNLAKDPVVIAGLIIGYIIGNLLARCIGSK